MLLSIIEVLKQFNNMIEVLKHASIKFLFICVLYEYLLVIHLPIFLQNLLFDISMFIECKTCIPSLL